MTKEKKQNKPKLRDKIEDAITNTVASLLPIDPCYQCPYADDCEGCESDGEH